MEGLLCLDKLCALGTTVKLLRDAGVTFQGHQSLNEIVHPSSRVFRSSDLVNNERKVRSSVVLPPVCTKQADMMTRWGPALDICAQIV